MRNKVDIWRTISGKAEVGVELGLGGTFPYFRDHGTAKYAFISYSP